MRNFLCSPLCSWKNWHLFLPPSTTAHCPRPRPSACGICCAFRSPPLQSGAIATDRMKKMNILYALVARCRAVMDSSKALRPSPARRAVMHLHCPRFARGCFAASYWYEMVLPGVNLRPRRVSGSSGPSTPRLFGFPLVILHFTPSAIL